MAKGNMLLGQARGSVGDLTFSRSNGKQVIRAKASQVRNPQSDGQVLQRTLLNTISQAYSKMIAIVDHSYEGFKVGQDQMAQFMKVNLRALRARVSAYQQSTGVLSGIYAFTPIGSKDLSINPYIMSMGTLPGIAITNIDLSNESDQCAVVTLPGISEEPTYADIITAFGLKKGDQVTFVTLNYDATNGSTFNYARVILEPVNDDLTDAELTSAFIVDGEINLPNDRNEGVFARLSAGNGTIRFSVGSAIPVAACVIVSRQNTDGEWLRSNATLSVVDDLASYGQYDLLSAMNAFYSGGVFLESNYYLNNAIAGITESATAGSTAMSLVSVYASGSGFKTYGQTVSMSGASFPTIAVNIQNYNADQTPIFVMSPRTLTVGSEFTAESGDLQMPLTGNSNTFNPTGVSGTTYKGYFVWNGIVKSRHGAVVWTEASTAPTVSALTVGGNSLLDPDGTAPTISINEAQAVSITVDNYSDLNSPILVAMSQGIAKGTDVSSQSKRQQLSLTGSTTTGSWTGTTIGAFQCYIIEDNVVTAVLGKYTAADMSEPGGSGEG